MLLSNMTSSVPIAWRHEACIQRWNAVFWTPLYEVRWRAPSTDCLMQGNKLLKVAWVGVNDCLLFQQLLLTCQKAFHQHFQVAHIKEERAYAHIFTNRTEYFWWVQLHIFKLPSEVLVLVCFDVRCTLLAESTQKLFILYCMFCPPLSWMNYFGLLFSQDNNLCFSVVVSKSS